MNDSDIIGLFLERSEEAIVELSKKYGRLCLHIAKNITGDEQDAKECVNDAYLATWKTIPPNTPDPLMAYVCRLTRNISINRYKYNNRKRRGGYEVCLEELEECLCDFEGPDDKVSDHELEQRIQEFVRGMEETDRMIFIRRFWYFDTYQRIAELSGIKEGALRMRVSRIKTKLKKYLSEKGVIV